MGAFEYIALDERGREKKGVLEGDAPRAVRATLRAKGLTPLEVREVEDHSNVQRLFSLERGMSITDLSLFTRQLATLSRASLPMEEALKAVAEQTENSRSQRIILGVRSQVVEGRTLATALASFPGSFNQLYRATIAAGEQSGQLDEVLEGLADYVEGQQAIRLKLIGALVYPAFLTILVIGIVTLLMVMVVPDLVQTFESNNAELPLLTRILIAISDFLRTWGWLLGLAIPTGAAGAVYTLRREHIRYEMHKKLLTLPILGRLIRSINTARLTRTLSILTRSGVPVLEAMTIGAEVISNLPMREAVQRAATKVREGESIHRALGAERLFPPITLHMIANGELSGELEAMLKRAAEHQEREMETFLQSVLGILGPAVILVMGGMVLLIVLAILLPVFDLNQLVR